MVKSVHIKFLSVLTAKVIDAHEAVLIFNSFFYEEPIAL